MTSSYKIDILGIAQRKNAEWRNTQEAEGRSRGARVQIPLSPLWFIPLSFNLLDGRETRYKRLKKVLDNVEKML